MPLYEYQCEACGTRVEKIQKFSDPPLATCGACGGAMRKLPSSPAIQFKGTGWYITDYAKKTAVEGTAGTSSKTDSSKTSDASKTESKTDSKTESTGTASSGSSASDPASGAKT
jgi:putative FmdB family regulatory protein